MMLTPNTLARVRQEFAYLAVKASYHGWRSILKAGFDPNQPRVPAGNPDGGQWTRVGGGTASRTRETIRRDDTGTEPWHAVITRRREDGSLAQETVLNRDGSAIRSDFPEFPDEASFDERHTVTGADGTIVTFQDAGSTQTIFGPDGQFLSECLDTRRTGVGRRRAAGLRARGRHCGGRSHRRDSQARPDALRLVSQPPTTGPTSGCCIQSPRFSAGGRGRHSTAGVGREPHA